MYTVQYGVRCTVQGTVNITVYSEVYGVNNSEWGTVYYEVYNVHCTVQYTVNSIVYDVGVQFALNSTSLDLTNLRSSSVTSAVRFLQ